MAQAGWRHGQHEDWKGCKAAMEWEEGWVGRVMKCWYARTTYYRLSGKRQETRQETRQGSSREDVVAWVGGEE